MRDASGAEGAPPVERYRALLEATAYGVRHNLQAMRDAGGKIDRVVAVGQLKLQSGSAVTISTDPTPPIPAKPPRY